MILQVESLRFDQVLSSRCLTKRGQVLNKTRPQISGSKLYKNSDVESLYFLSNETQISGSKLYKNSDVKSLHFLSNKPQILSYSTLACVAATTN